jgi:hypothetical protein
MQIVREKREKHAITDGITDPFASVTNTDQQRSRHKNGRKNARGNNPKTTNQTFYGPILLDFLAKLQ